MSAPSLKQFIHSFSTSEDFFNHILELLHPLVEATKTLSDDLRKMELSSSLRGGANSNNTAGDQQKKMDLHANQLFIEQLSKCPLVRSFLFIQR